EVAVVDMAGRRDREQAYLSLNPYGRVPTLEEDGFVLFESTAILNYLEATRFDQHLAAKTYLVAEQFSLADVCYAPFLEFLPLMEITPHAAIAAWSERLLSRPSAITTRPGK